MVTHDKIEEWIKEVEERPSSAPVIIRYIANRLSELNQRNEELLADNIGLRSEKKVEDYENRIANLEYQVGLLKRQLGGQALSEGNSSLPVMPMTISLVFFTPKGKIIRAIMPASELETGKALARFSPQAWADGEFPQVLAVHSSEELLLIYDTGRIITVEVEDIPAGNPLELDWEKALLREPKSGEGLSAIVPIGRMGLHDYAIQVSRRGFVKKIMESSFETFVANRFIGAGLKATADKPYSLALANKEDRLVLLSQEGFALSMEVSRLPFAIEGILQLSPNDHIVSVGVVPNEITPPAQIALVGITDNGKVINRDLSWLEPAVSFRSRGQSLFSKEKRSSGVRLVGGGCVQDASWAVMLDAQGQTSAHKVSDLFAAGTTSLPSRWVGLSIFLA